ncbi:hypothetical protein [Endozoicomonas lisbonensis]|uniref:Uncharacterized protein n=1 Tax=Endozoicomonas lisbonensis TaxID=3120522 RepID=A0ABV2SIX2_9GAMM
MILASTSHRHSEKKKRSIIVFCLSFFLFSGIFSSRSYAATEITPVVAKIAAQLGPEAIKVILKQPYSFRHLSDYDPKNFVVTSLGAGILAITMGSNLFIVSKDRFLSALAVLGTAPFAFESVHSVLSPVVNAVGKAGSAIKSGVVTMYHGDFSGCVGCPGAAGGAISKAFSGVVTFFRLPLPEMGLKAAAPAHQMLGFAIGILMTPADAISAGEGMKTVFCEKESGGNETSPDSFSLDDYDGIGNGYYVPAIGQNSTATAVSQAADLSEGTCEQVAYWVPLVLNALPTAAVGRNAGLGVISQLATTGVVDPVNAAVSAWKGTEYVSTAMQHVTAFKAQLPDYLTGLEAFQGLNIEEGIGFLGDNAQKVANNFVDLVDDAVDLADDISGMELQTLATTVAEGGWTPDKLNELASEISVRAYKDLSTREMLLLFDPSKEFGRVATVGLGIMQWAITAGAIGAARPMLLYAFNSGKIRTLSEREGFEYPEAGIVVFPNGIAVDVNDPNFKVNETLVDEFREEIERVDLDMLINEVTYTTQSIIVACFGFLVPAMNILSAATKIKMGMVDGNTYPNPPYYWASLFESFAISGTGGYLYFRNLYGAIPHIEKVIDYRKAIGETDWFDAINPFDHVSTAVGALVGMFTISGGLAIQPYVMVCTQYIGNKLIIFGGFIGSQLIRAKSSVGGCLGGICP